MVQESAYFNKYRGQVVPSLLKKYGYKNAMLVPKLEKIVVSSCLAEAIQTVKVLDVAGQEIAQITGQKPLVTKAKKSIATFKLREGMPIGLKVTLRGKRMYEFMNRLINTAMPRMRDFQGIDAKGFDGRGNYNFGITEQIIFQEIDFDKVDKLRGMNITFVTTARTDDEARDLLKEMGMPFKQ